MSNDTCHPSRLPPFRGSVTVPSSFPLLHVVTKPRNTTHKFTPPHSRRVTMPTGLTHRINNCFLRELAKHLRTISRVLAAWWTPVHPLLLWGRACLPPHCICPPASNPWLPRIFASWRPRSPNVACEAAPSVQAPARPSVPRSCTRF